MEIKRKKMNKSAKAREKKRLKELSLQGEQDLFDYVLVDAECSTDGAVGSLKHRLKTDLKAAEANAFRISDQNQTNLAILQKNLLMNGFSNLKPGGTIVYATCSLSKKQNEEIIQNFIVEVNKDKIQTELEPI